MARKFATVSLTDFFAREIEANHVATLKSVRQHLQTPGGRAPLGSLTERQRWQAEIEELIGMHGEDCPVADFITRTPPDVQGSPGAHG